MILGGEAYIPPACPSLRMGSEARVERMEFSYSSGEYINDSGMPITETSLQFFLRDDSDDGKWTTASAYAEWPKGSVTAEQSLEVGNGPAANHMQQRIRELLCDRIAQCHGVTNLGCWALNKAALIELHTQIMDKFDSNKP